MLAAIRIRGQLDLSPPNRHTLELMGLHKKNHLVLLHETKEQKNMLRSVNAFIAYGNIDETTLTALLEKRGRLTGNRHLNAEFLKASKLNGFPELSQAILNGKTTLQKMGIKKVFRLNSPRKGFERGGIRKSFKEGGVLGNRGTKINELIAKMM
ncbi:MAG: 50S ribosomal protein L30 [Candidatus Diapherotrites archaeon]|nr:50S ribosomal protein L30 [Candidatus Diapherotrites archaeon]